MNTSPRFGAPWAKGQILVTAAVSAVFLFVLCQVSLAPWRSAWRTDMQIGLLFAFAAGPFFMVRGYEVGADELDVLRLGWRTHLPLAGLTAVEVLPKLSGATLRLFGNGGYWSCTGWFWNRALGRFRLFANRLRGVVVLRYAGRCVVLVPDRPEELADLVRRRAGLS